MIVVAGPPPRKKPRGHTKKVREDKQSLESWEHSMEKANFTSQHLSSDFIMLEDTYAPASQSVPS
jgi:hypothetical protein